MPFARTKSAAQTRNDKAQSELPPAAPLPAALQTLACWRWPVAYFERCRARYGSRFTVHPLDMPPLVFLSDPDEVRAVLTAPADVLQPGAGGAVVRPLFGEDSFTLLDGDEHMAGREALKPALGRGAVQAHEEAVAEVVRSAVAAWPLGKAFAATPHLRALTLRVIMRVVFGGESWALRELHGRLLEMLSVMATPLLQQPRLRRLPGWSARWRRFERRREEVDRSIFALLARRRGADGRRCDVLDALLAARRSDGLPWTDRQVRDNLVSVLIAGHETIASQLAWAFQLLAHNQVAQRRLIEEIDGGGAEERLTATLAEVMRHRPVFLFAAPRVVAQPIEIGRATYRPPVQLLACVYLVHHDPAVYPDPQEFRPERFLVSPPRPRVWLPWGGGRKRCLGQHLAALEMRAVLRGVLAGRVILPAGPRIERPRWRTVTVTPHAGSRVVLGAWRSNRNVFGSDWNGFLDHPTTGAS